MKIGIVGPGGREGAMVRKLFPEVENIFAIPGNPGMESQAVCEPINFLDHAAVISWAKRYSLDLVVIGPEDPLIAGLADDLRNICPTFGPNKRAAIIEGSKAFAKEFMERHGIPTAPFRVCRTLDEACQAIDYFASLGKQVVVKASGPASGKGAFVTYSVAEAKEKARQILEEHIFGVAGNVVVVEERFFGWEASIFVLTDGIKFVVLPPAQDHKRLLENDKGPNTGGMGAYCPVPMVTDELMGRIINTIIEPTLAGMKKEDREYRGCLYLGLIIVDGRPFVIEYNCRFGDPETQVVLPSFRESLSPIMLECATGSLLETRILSPICSAGIVVIVSDGYPGPYQTGKEISGIFPIESNLWVIQAGTRLDGDKLLTAGGRVLDVVGTDSAINREGILRAIQKAYEGVERIYFEGKRYRADIGFRLQK